MPVPTNIPAAVGERVPEPIVVGTKVGGSLPVRVKGEEGVPEDLRVGLTQKEPVDTPDEVRGNLNVKQREAEMKKEGFARFMVRNMQEFKKFMLPPKGTPEDEAEWERMQELDAFGKQQRQDDEDAVIARFMDRQAGGDQEGFLDSMLGLFSGGNAGGGSAGDPDPSSGSSSAVQPKGKAKPPNHTVLPPGNPFAHSVGERVQEMGTQVLRSKDFDRPHARRDNNKARQRQEAMLVGGQ